ncbi:MAG: type IX secretion system membrane protein PorP/SprF [Cytophagaceae bacterium]
MGLNKAFKKVLFGAGMLFSSQLVNAQQQGQYSQYMMNYFLINPAVSGVDDFVDIRAGYRNQWTGLDGAPRNYYVTAHTPLNKIHSKLSKKKANPHHTLGAIVSGQTLGVFQHNTAYLTYAYHMPLTKKAMVSVGVQAGANQISVDRNKLNWGDNVADPVESGSLTRTKFDMGLGMWFYTPKFFAGISSMQILQNRLNFSEGDASGTGVLNRHYYLTAGYRIKIDDNWTYIPSVLLKGTTAAYQIDINSKVRYKDFFWAGASYRRTDALVLLAGVGIPLSSLRPNQKHGNNALLEIGYSYDATTSKLNKFSSGSHEIMVGLRLPTQGRMLCPQDYW